MHCGNSWFVCTECGKAFKGRRYSVEKHFRTVHNWKPDYDILPMSETNNLKLQHKQNDEDMMTTFDIDNNNQKLTS